MKKMMIMALLGLMFMGGANAMAQEDSATVAEEPKDTISIDNMEPIFYEEEAAEEPSNTMTYALIGGIVVIGGAAFFYMRKKKK
ncbi:MAG: LPXTG cell wall anchor domain-containing protein [Prolixibacteraceae bacterium]|nr:LPXTG cell wall anchor domain-containing protein [Prolixibacteraceae bacterium]